MALYSLKKFFAIKKLAFTIINGAFTYNYSDV